MVGYAEGLGEGTGSTHARHYTLLHGCLRSLATTPDFVHAQTKTSAREGGSGLRGRKYGQLTTSGQAASSCGSDGAPTGSGPTTGRPKIVSHAD